MSVQLVAPSSETCHFTLCWVGVGLPVYAMLLVRVDPEYKVPPDGAAVLDCVIEVATRVNVLEMAPLAASGVQVEEPYSTIYFRTDESGKSFQYPVEL